MLAKAGARPGLLKKRIGTLSGGELQRVLLAFALQPMPDLLLLDVYKRQFQALVKTSRLETGVIRLEKKQGRIYDTVAQAMSGIVYAAEKKQIGVSVDCPENLTAAHDGKWTAEALFNLLDNAVKYTPADGKITVTVEEWEMYVEIKVADTGKGISESSQAAIFRRFYREEEVHEQPGVGIGLYLAREIITQPVSYTHLKYCLCSF